jgi:hypothetical protein
MKFLCGNCKAKYQIADEKLEGRTLRMICRECGKEIIIQGKLRAPGYPAAGAARGAIPAPPARASSVLAEDFRRQLGERPPERRAAPPMEQWHVAINDIPVGPMNRSELVRKIELGAVNADSLAWREGLDDWMPARQIPELAILFAPPPAPSAAAMYEPRYAERPPPPRPPEPVRPAARYGVAPIGGRMVAERPYEEFTLPPAPPPEAPQMAASPLARALEAPAPPTVTGQMWQMAGPLFAAICAGALLIMGGAWVGVRYFSPPPVTKEVTIEKVTQAPAAAGEQSGGVVALDQQDIDGVLEQQSSGRSAQQGKGSEPQKEVKKPASSGKQLSEAEKEMLARMGGGLDQGASTLRERTGGTSDRSGGSGQGLTAEQLSKVVSSGKRELQRCYEAALRANPSDETIRLDIEINVGMSGKVTSVKTSGHSLGQMGTCIERTIRMWSFPAAGEVTRTTFPVVFQPGA